MPNGIHRTTANSLPAGLPLHSPAMMIPILMVWLYFALLVSAMQWPNVFSMLLTFLLLGTVPVFMLYRLLVLKRQQNQLAKTEDIQSVHAGMRNPDQQDSGKD
jgi:O-antigen ligase